jgi:hypothetical protein
VDELLPDAIPVWRDGLAAVDANHSKLVSSTKRTPNDGGYVFPDPGLFVSCTTNEKKARYFHHWKELSDLMKFRVSDGQANAQPLSNQVWRDILNGLHLSVSEGNKAAKRRDDWMKILGSCMDDVPAQFSPTANPVSFVMPSVAEARAVLWELYELNFRCELVALDSRLGGKEESHISGQSRQDQIMMCFPPNPTGPCLLVADQSLSKEGLASNNIQKRGPYLLALRDIIRAWKGPKPNEILQTKLMRQYHEKELVELEKQLVLYYTQTFFNHFGRAAMIPHRLD